jgi:two-component system response regulator MprA
MLLIVDDDAKTAATLARVLRLEGYNVVTACGPEDGLRAIATSRPHALVLDLAMPRIDQVSFLRRVRAHRNVRHTAIAVITADFVDDELDVELDGLNAVVCFKPLWLQDLVRITEHLLRGLHDETADGAIGTPWPSECRRT